MNMIIGGAYQGKLEYALKTYGFGENDIFTCTEDTKADFSKPCIQNLEEFVLYCLKNGISAREIMEKNRAKWQNSVIICREIFSGVVPIDTLIRQWRDETGRVLTWLSQEADSVTRMFCGIPQKLK